MTSGRDIARALGGAWRGKGASVCCPAHEDRDPSLSVSETRDGRPLVFCHAGCSQAAVIDALKKRGLWEGEPTRDPSYPGYITVKHDRFRNRDDRENHRYALDLWEKADRIKGTLAETYLKARGLKSFNWPDSLGFLPSVPHKPSGRSFPCMLSAVTDGMGDVLAVQRTYLAEDGSAKAQVSPAKMTLGNMGNGCVKLGRPTDTLGIAEGVETALSAKQIYMIPTWATLSANRLDKVQVPKNVTHIIIFADNGPVGMSSACDAAEVYERQGLVADVMPPSVHFKGNVSDFNDVLRAGI